MKKQLTDAEWAQFNDLKKDLVKAMIAYREFCIVNFGSRAIVSRFLKVSIYIGSYINHQGKIEHKIARTKWFGTDKIEDDTESE